MSPRDTHDDRPDGATPRQHPVPRCPDLDRDGAARRARLAQRNALEELWHEVVHAHSIQLH